MVGWLVGRFAETTSYRWLGNESGSFKLKSVWKRVDDRSQGCEQECELAVGLEREEERRATSDQRMSGINRFSGQRIGGTIGGTLPPDRHARYWEIRQIGHLLGSGERRHGTRCSVVEAVEVDCAAFYRGRVSVGIGILLGWST